MKPVIELLFSLDNFINCISIVCSWNLRMMSEKWLFSNHVDIEVVTTLLLQSVVVILSAVCALICITVLWNCSTFRLCHKLTKWKSSKRMLLHAASICHKASNPDLNLLDANRAWTKCIFNFECLKLYQISPQLCGCRVWPNPWKWQKKLYTKIEKTNKQTKKTTTKKTPTSRSRGLWLPNKITDWRVFLLHWKFK